MRPKRWVASGIIASCLLAPLAPGCGNDSFTSPDLSETSTADGTTSDALPSEASGDAGVFCIARPNQILCADFDEPDLRTALTVNGSGFFFSDTTTTDGGKLFRSGNGLSPPSSLETSLLALDADASITAQTGGALSNAPSANHFKFTASVRFNAVGDLSGSGTVGLMGFALAGPAATTSYEVIVNGGHVEVIVVNELGVMAGIDLGVIPAPSENWLPFALDVTVGGGKLTASLGAVSGSSGGYADMNHTQASVALGVASTGGTGALDVSYDNILVYAEKVDAGILTITDAGVGTMTDAGDD
jgi:hypothetical protein